MSDLHLVATNELIQGFIQQYPDECAKLLNTFSPEDILKYLRFEPINRAAQIYTQLNPDIIIALITIMEENFFAQLFREIDPARSARILSQFGQAELNRLLSLLPKHISSEISELMTYPPETAGSLMDAKVLTFNPDATIEYVLQKIRTITDRRVLHIYVTDVDGQLKGIIPLQEIVVAQLHEEVGNLINTQPISIQGMSPRDDVVQLFEERKVISLAVVDADNNLLGIIRHDALVNAAKQDVSEDLQAMFGAGRDERALSKVSFAIRKRLPWLEINLATAFLAAAVVGLFEDTIARITVLAVFLPVVAGQSGNTGSQALAVTMRGLALREIRPRHWFRISRKEMAVGFINGCAVSLTTSLIVYIWTTSLGLALVIAVAMVFSMVMAGFSGAVIPILLKSIGQDPAQSSSIILTTITDVVGFMSFLGLATVFSAFLGIT